LTADSSNPTESARLPSIPRLGAKASVAVLAVALTVRLAAVAVTDPTRAHFGDAPPYQMAARMIADTGRYPFRTDPHYFRAPGYPAFLALVTAGRPERVVAAKVANVIVGSLAAVVLAAISARLFRRRDLALATGIAAALNPAFVLVSSEVQSEPLFMLMLLAAGWLLLVAVDRPSSNVGVAGGIGLGLSALVRPSAIAVVPLLAAPLADRRYPPRIRLHLAGSAALGFVLSVAPWTLRNALVYREFIPISDVGGFNFFLGNSEQMLRFFQVQSRRGYDLWAVETDRMIDNRMKELNARGISSPAAVTRELVRETMDNGARHPGLIARLLAHKSWDWFRPYPNPYYWPRAVVVPVAILYAALYVLAARGLLVAPRRGVALFCLLVLLASMAAHVLTVVSWRYRIPYWDPVLLLYAPAGAMLRLSGRPSHI